MKLFFLKSCNCYINLYQIVSIDTQRKKLIMSNNEEYQVRQYELNAIEIIGGINGL